MRSGSSASSTTVHGLGEVRWTAQPEDRPIWQPICTLESATRKVEFPMSRKHEPGWNVEELTDAEISAAIRYLDPCPITNAGSEQILNAIRYLDRDLNTKIVQEDKKTALLIFLTALVVLFYGFVFVWCHRC
jgi:hypothetical protein